MVWEFSKWKMCIKIWIFLKRKEKKKNPFRWLTHHMLQTDYTDITICSGKACLEEMYVKSSFSFSLSFVLISINYLFIEFVVFYFLFFFYLVESKCKQYLDDRFSFVLVRSLGIEWMKQNSLVAVSFIPLQYLKFLLDIRRNIEISILWSW